MKKLLLKGALGFLGLSMIVHVATTGGLAPAPPPSPAAAAQHAPPASSPAPAPAPQAPALAGTPGAPELWARALLKYMGLRRTPCNVGAVMAWEKAEGGAWHNKARRNPLNDTLPEPGSWLMPGRNPAHVRAYPTWLEGIQATVHTLRFHPAITAALRRGNDAQAVADAVQAPSTTGHHWGTRPFRATCSTKG